MSDAWQNVKGLIEYPEDGILSKQLLKSDKTDVTLFCMAKGTEISEHTSTKKGFVFVIEGKGRFSLEGESINMLPGVLIYLEKNAVHSLKAEEDTAFVLLLQE
jgi:nitric oxide dioxygenase